MTLKNTWANGEQFQASDANNVADAVNAAYVKPGTGIPSADLASAVQTSLGKADSAVQSVSSTSITDASTTGKAILVATDAATARTALGVSYGTSSGTVAQGNDSRFTPASTSISDSTATGRALLTTTDASTARTTLGVAYGTSSGTVAQGNDSRITGAQQTSEKGNANGYASLDSGGKVPIGQLPSSIMEYQGVWNASTNTPTLADGTGSPGDVYRVSVAGSRNLGSGSISFAVGDYCVMNSSNVWEKSDTTDAVSSVAGRTGDITLTVADISATGTPSSSNYLRGDGSWQTVTSGMSRSVSTVTTSTTLGATANTDYVTLINTGGSVTLPTAASNTNLYTIKNISSTTKSIATTSSQTIEAKNTVGITAGSCASLLSDGSNWRILNSYGTVLTAADYVTSSSGIVTGGTNSFTLTFDITTDPSSVIMVFVNACLYYNNGSFNLTSATLGGNAMTTVQSKFTTNTGNTYGWLLGITGNFSGTYSVSVAANGANQGCSAAGIAASYTNASGWATPVTGTTATVNATSGLSTFFGAAGTMAGTPGLSVSGGTIRRATNDSPGNSYIQVADALSKTSASFVCTSGTAVGVEIT